MLNFITAIFMEGFQKESEMTRAVPFSMSFVNMWQKLKVFFFSKHAMRTLYNALVARTRRLREAIVADHLYQAYQSELYQMGITEELLRKGEVEVPYIPMRRQHLSAIIPPEDVTYITEKYLDQLWVDFVNEYEFQKKDEDERQEAETRGQFETGFFQAFTSVLLHSKSIIAEKCGQILGESTEDESATSPHSARSTTYPDERKKKELVIEMFKKPPHGLVGIDVRTAALETNLAQINALLTLQANKLGAIVTALNK
jgi:hypothetical protein